MQRTARDAIRIVSEDGWYFVRQSGSHRQYRHPVKKGTVTIPGHPGEVLAIGTWKNIMRQARIKI